MRRRTISLRKSLLQFLVAEMKLTSYQLIHQKERVFLFRQQGMREKIGKKAGGSLFDKTFYNENKEKNFCQAISTQLLSNFEL